MVSPRYSWLCLRAIPADIPSPETFVAQIMRQDAAEGAGTVRCQFVVGFSRVFSTPLPGFQLDSGLLRVLLFGLDDKTFFLQLRCTGIRHQFERSFRHLPYQKIVETETKKLQD